MTRMTFRFNEQTNKYVSRQPLMSDQGLLVVTIDVETYTWTITKYETSEVVTSGNARNFNSSKRLAKEMVQELGVHFNDEVRTRTPKEVTHEVVNG